MISQQTWLRLLGGAFLMYLGIRTFLAKTGQAAATASGDGLAGAYASTLFLTLTNPLTIISFAAMFAGLGIASGSRDYASAAALVAGVFLGSASWWFILSGGVSVFRSRFDLQAMNWVNRFSGAIILGFGLLALLSLGIGD